MQLTNTLGTRGSEVAGDDALDTNVLRGTDDVLLVSGVQPGAGDDENVDAAESGLQLLYAIMYVALTDLDARGAQSFCSRLCERCGTNERCNTLDGTEGAQCELRDRVSERRRGRCVRSLLTPVGPSRWVPPWVRSRRPREREAWCCRWSLSGEAGSVNVDVLGSTLHPRPRWPLYTNRSSCASSKHRLR